MSFRNSDVEGSTGSGAGWLSAVYGSDLGGNIDVDPFFTDPPSVDYRPLPASPVGDKGDDDPWLVSPQYPDVYDLDRDGDTSEPTPELDLEPRLQDNGVDIGAYEGATCPAQVFVDVDATGANDGTSGHCTASSRARARMALPSAEVAPRCPLLAARRSRVSASSGARSITSPRSMASPR